MTNASVPQTNRNQAALKAWATRRARQDGTTLPPVKAICTSRTEAANKAWATRRARSSMPVVQIAPKRRTSKVYTRPVRTVTATSARELLAMWGVQITQLTKATLVIFAYDDLRIAVNGRLLRDFLMAAPYATFTVDVPPASHTSISTRESVAPTQIKAGTYVRIVSNLAGGAKSTTTFLDMAGWDGKTSGGIFLVTI